MSLPGGAFYFLFDVHKFYGRKFHGQFIADSVAMATYLLDHHLVGAVPGIAFGADTCLRISYACSMMDLEKGMARIRQGLEALS